MRMHAARIAAAISATTVLVLAVAACKPQAPPESHAPASPEKHAAPAPKRQASRPDPVPEPQPDQREALRFDMTQQGRAQTAENFDAWMAQQGVRVAKGKPQDATPASSGTDPAQSTKASQSQQRPQSSVPQRE